MPRIDFTNPEPTWYQRKYISIFGPIQIGRYSGPMYYMWRCKRHGYVVDYPHGEYSPFDSLPYGAVSVVVDGIIRRLDCPKCREETHQEKKV